MKESIVASFKDLVGASTTLRQIRARVELATGSNVPLFLQGEKGVGKETIARLVAGEPLVKLRCDLLTPENWDALLSDAIPKDLFPGAVGAIYLEELDATPIETQVRLAKKLRAGKTPWRALLGSSRDPGADVWATELADALAAFPSELPPLRERPDDLPELARRFFREALRELGAWNRDLTREELDRLRAAAYPENLDDLRRAVEFLARDGSLPEEFPDGENAPEANGREHFPSLDEAAIRHIEAALRLTGGVVEGENGAAKLLKINPYTLRSRMRKMKVDWTKFRVERPSETETDDEKDD